MTGEFAGRPSRLGPGAPAVAGAPGGLVTAWAALLVLALCACPASRSLSGDGEEDADAGDQADVPSPPEAVHDAGRRDDAGLESDSEARDDARDIALDWTRPDYGEPPPSSCGDETLDHGEECDDGNRMNGDGCDWRCRIGDGDVPPADPDPEAGRLSPDATQRYVERTPGEHWHQWGHPPSRIPFVWTGSAYATVWMHEPYEGAAGPTEARFLRLDTAGRMLDDGWRYDLGEPTQFLGLAWNGSRFALVFAGGWSTSVRAMILNSVGKPLVGPFAIADGLVDVTSVTVVWGGSTFACLWAGSRLPGDGPMNVAQLVRFDEYGNLAPDRPASYPPIVGARDAGLALAWSGRSYMAAWVGSDVARYAFLPLDPASPFEPRTIGPSANESIDLVWAVDRFAVAWFVPDPAGEYNGVLHVARFGPDGALLGPPTADPSGPTVVSGGPGLAAAYGARTVAVTVTRMETGVTLRLSRFDLEGTFVDHAVLTPYETARVSGTGVGIAFDGSAFGVLADGGGPLLVRREVLW